MRMSTTAAGEVEAARTAIRSLDFPNGIRGFTIREGHDEDGDPIVWVLFAVEDHDRRDMSWVRNYTPFLKAVRRKLYDILQEHRPLVGLT